MTMPNQRSIGLDLLRFVAVVMVIVSHLVLEPIPDRLMPYLQYVLGYGPAGVNLFFVLSGFLVSGLLFNEYKRKGQISARRFYVRRAWKIYPAFYLLIGLTYVYCRFALDYKIHDRIVARELFFFQNYAPGIWNQTWSLAVEEHFYLLLPLILLVMAKRRGGVDPFKSMPGLVLAIAIVALTLRCLTCHWNPNYGFYTHGFPTHLRIDGLFIGVALSYYYHFQPMLFRRATFPWRYALIGLGAAGLISARLLHLGHWYGYTLAPLQDCISAAAILCGVMASTIPRNWLTLTLAKIGSYSYSIYLWHMVAIQFVTPRLRDSVAWEWRAALYLTSAFAVGIIMANIWELPLLKLRDRWFPSESPARKPAPDVPQQTTQVAA
jgi:peptidoglycan/LPS O-acetylase OafA/YrhL